MFLTSSRDRLNTKMDKASSYLKWSEAAADYDFKMGFEEWKKSDSCESYDYRAIRHRLDIIRDLRMRRDYPRLLFTLNEGIHGNLGGMGKPSLYNKSKLGTKSLIHQYLNVLTEALDDIDQAPSDQISDDEKEDFFLRASHCNGRSALMLSGGANLGFFHAGIIKALFEQNQLPHVISGSSAGSIVAAITCTHGDDEFLDKLDPRNMQMIEISETKRAPSKFGAIDINTMVENIKLWIPDLTFEEAFELTGRALNITVSGLMPNQAPRLLNATTSPNITIRSAVQASCAVYGIYPPVTLEAKNSENETVPYLPGQKWIDGSFLDDLPAKRLARLYGVNHFISSMINPAVLATTGNPDKRESMIDNILQSQKRLVKLTTLEAVKFSRRYIRVKSPLINMMQYLSYNILAQDYTADINLFPRSRWFNPFNLLGRPPAKVIKQRFHEGERAAWERLEMISNCTKISRKLDNIVDKNGWKLG